VYINLILRFQLAQPLNNTKYQIHNCSVHQHLPAVIMLLMGSPSSYHCHLLHY